MRGNFLLRDDIDEQMTEEKEAGRRTQLLDDLGNRRRYWELKLKPSPCTTSAILAGAHSFLWYHLNVMEKIVIMT